MYYEWRHIVTFEETNLVGNVYYANHVRWQGRCREMFLKDHAESVLQMFQEDLVMVTTKVSCEYFNELFAFDHVLIKMQAGSVTESRITMLFDYFRQQGDKEELIAKGEQQIACMLRNGLPTPIPQVLRDALNAYIHTL